MQYALVQDIAASWEQYELHAAQLVDPVPAGLIVQVAGPTEEGFRVIALWESEAAWRRFQRERVEPAIAALGGPARPEPTVRDLRPVHVVLGTAAGNPDPDPKEEFHV